MSEGSFLDFPRGETEDDWRSVISTAAARGDEEGSHFLLLLLLARTSFPVQLQLVNALGRVLRPEHIRSFPSASAPEVAGQLASLVDFEATPEGRAAVAELLTGGIPDVCARFPRVALAILREDMLRGLAGDARLPTVRGRLALARTACDLQEARSAAADTTLLEAALRLVAEGPHPTPTLQAKAEVWAARLATALGAEERAWEHLVNAVRTEAAESFVAQALFRALQPRDALVTVTDSLATKAFGGRSLRSREHWDALVNAAPELARGRQALERAGLLVSAPAHVSPTACGTLKRILDLRRASIAGDAVRAKAALEEALAAPGVTNHGKARSRALFALSLRTGSEALRADAVEQACLALNVLHDDTTRRALEHALNLGSPAEGPRVRVTGQWEDELPTLSLLATSADHSLQFGARYRLGFLSIVGRASANTQRKLFDPVAGRLALGPLEQDPQWAPLVTRLLADPRPSAILDLQREDHGQRYVLHRVEGSRTLLVVFACVFTHARFAELVPFSENASCHVMFVNDPALHWYERTARDAIQQLIVRTAEELGIARENIIAHYGSMGGYGALRVASELGCAALVFNPQVDLDLWATIRAPVRPQLWREREPELGGASLVPARTFYLCGTWAPDVEALRRWLGAVLQARSGRHVVMRSPDGVHAGLAQRFFGAEYPSRACALGDEMTRWTDEPGPLAFVARHDEESLVSRLLATPDLRLELRFVRGELYACEHTPGQRDA